MTAAKIRPNAAPSFEGLTRTHALLQEGIDRGTQLGAQLWISLGAGSTAPRQWDVALGDRAVGLPMTPDTLLIWLSSTKPIGAVALAQLWERGLLDLDDPVAEYVPEFAAHGKGGITLRHVLTHTGGFRMLNLGWPDAPWEEVIATICRSRPEPRWVPGQTAGYHMASSWFILGEVIRRVDGRSFSKYVREEVFEPLGMENSWVGMPQERFEAYGDRIGRMYGTDREAPLERGWYREAHVVACSPGGNGHGPIRELGTFYAMLLAKGSVKGRALLAPQTVEALTSCHRVGLYDRTFKHKMDWGLGFIVNSEHYGAETTPYGYGGHASRRTFGHSGFQSSTAFADPEHDLVVALAVNGQPGEPRHTERFRRLTEAIYEDLDLADVADRATSIAAAGKDTSR